MQSLSAPRMQPVRKFEELKEIFQRRRGMSLEEFKKLYPHYQRGLETSSEFRRIDSMIQFLEDNGCYTYPEPRPGAWVTEGEAWVALDGYLPLHRYPPEWFEGHIRYKYLVNVIGVHARVLILDYATAQIWDYVGSNPVAYDKAMHWTLLVRPLVSDRPSYGEIHRAITSQLEAGVDPAHAVANGRLGIVQDHTHIPSLRPLLAGDLVPAPRKLFWFDGLNHMLLLPAWIFKLDMSYEVHDWTYFL